MACLPRSLLLCRSLFLSTTWAPVDSPAWPTLHSGQRYSLQNTRGCASHQHSLAFSTTTRSDKLSRPDCSSRKSAFQRLSFLGELNYEKQPCSFWFFKRNWAPCWWRKTRTYWQIDFFSYTDFHHKHKVCAAQKQEKKQRVLIWHISFSYFQDSCHILKGCSLTMVEERGQESHLFLPGHYFHADSHLLFLTSLYYWIDVEFLSFPTNHFIFVRVTAFANS